MENTKSPISQILLFQQLNNDTIPTTNSNSWHQSPPITTEEQQKPTIITTNNKQPATNYNNQPLQLPMTTTKNHYKHQPTVNYRVSLPVLFI